MIYMDPPYGVKFGSNFQPFVRKRDVTHNDDDDFTREPEMVKAYRDTWDWAPLTSRICGTGSCSAVSSSPPAAASSCDQRRVTVRVDGWVFGQNNFVVLIAYRRLQDDGRRDRSVVGALSRLVRQDRRLEAIAL
jgi:adenine-specific DNA-methyltransferase